MPEPTRALRVGAACCARCAQHTQSRQPPNLTTRALRVGAFCCARPHLDARLSWSACFPTLFVCVCRGIVPPRQPRPPGRPVLPCRPCPCDPNTIRVSTPPWRLSGFYASNTYHPTNLQPTNLPPTCQPTSLPTYQPTNFPSYHPTNLPTYHPTILPTYQPTNLPTYQPVVEIYR